MKKIIGVSLPLFFLALFVQVPSAFAAGKVACTMLCKCSQLFVITKNKKHRDKYYKNCYSKCRKGDKSNYKSKCSNTCKERLTRAIYRKRYNTKRKRDAYYKSCYGKCTNIHKPRSYVKVGFSKVQKGPKPSCGSKYGKSGGWGKAFQHMLTGKCYSCPSGYKRSISSISSKSACVKAGKGVKGLVKKILKNAKKSRVKYRGKAGCPKGYHIDLLKNLCYKCPSKNIRTVFSVTSNKACMGIDLSKLRNPTFVRKMKPELKRVQKKYGPAIKKVIAALKKIPKADMKKFTKLIFASNSKKRKALYKFYKKHRLHKLMTVVKSNKSDGSLADNGDSCSSNSDCNSGRCYSYKGNKTCRENEEFKTFTIGFGPDISVLAGVNISIGLAFRYLTKEGGGIGSNPRKAPFAKGYAGWAWTVGLSAGAGLDLELGFWKDINTNINGISHGFVAGGSFYAGFCVSFWWTYETKDAPPRFLGWTITPQGGASVEIEYIRGKTVLDQEFGKEELVD